MASPSSSALLSSYGYLGGNDSNTQTLLHFEGTSGTATFTDSSQNNGAWSTGNSAVISNTKAKFGTCSLRLNSTSIRIPTDVAYADVGAGPWTVDFWLNMDTLPTAAAGVDPGSYIYLSQYASADRGWGVGLEFSSSAVHMHAFWTTSGGASGGPVLSSAITPTTNQWNHYAWVKDNASGLLRFFFNGQAAGTSSGLSGVTIRNSSQPFAIGTTSDAIFLSSGYLDEMRFSNVARWVAPFTPNPQAYAP